MPEVCRAPSVLCIHRRLLVPEVCRAPSVLSDVVPFRPIYFVEPEIFRTPSVLSDVVSRSNAFAALRVVHTMKIITI